MSQETKIPFFRNFSPSMNLLTVFSLIFLGYVFATFFVFLLARPFWGINIFENQDALNDITNESILTLHRLIMIISVIFVFITPATVFRKFIEFEGQDYLLVRKKPSLKLLGITLLLFLICFPVSNFLFYLNNLVDFSSIAKESGDAIRAAEEENATFTKAILYTDTFSTYLINVVAIALLTAIGEEFVFRGIFQRLLIKMTRNVHVAVFFGAVLFSIMHFSYYGFLPRLFMGLILGYIYLSTANIWYCILFHFLNNAFAITFAWLMSKGYDLSFFDVLGSGDVDRWFGLGILLVLLLFGITQLKRLIRKDLVEEMKEY